MNIISTRAGIGTPLQWHRATKILENILGLWRDIVNKVNSRKSKTRGEKNNFDSQRFCYDVLHTDPETGKRISTAELMRRLAKKAEESPLIRNTLIRRGLGKLIKQ